MSEETYHESALCHVAAIWDRHTVRSCSSNGGEDLAARKHDAERLRSIAEHVNNVPAKQQLLRLAEAVEGK